MNFLNEELHQLSLVVGFLGGVLITLLLERIRPRK